MLNRRHIRIKVMQTLYAFNEAEDDLKKYTNFLNKSMEDMYELHLSLLSLLVEVHKKAELILKKSQKKHLATEADKNPSYKFLDNAILKSLRENEAFEEALDQKKIKLWDLDSEYVEIIFKGLVKADFYSEYLKVENDSLYDDKEFFVRFYSEVVATNDKLYDYLEDKKLTWVDDFPVINTHIIKLARKYKPSKSEDFFLKPLFKNQEDKEFASELLKKVVLNRFKYIEEISSKTKNWDSERIARMDFVLLQMAICEFQSFPSIPHKVTINEYLEISKEYSTPKSRIFINGILDKIVKEYKVENVHQKIGRGLL